MTGCANEDRMVAVTDQLGGRQNACIHRWRKEILIPLIEMRADDDRTSTSKRCLYDPSDRLEDIPIPFRRHV